MTNETTKEGGPHDHSRELAVTVMLTNPETDEAVVFTPGDSPPDWARELITNPNVWKTADGTSSAELPAAGTGQNFLTVDDVQNEGAETPRKQKRSS